MPRQRLSSGAMAGRRLRQDSAAPGKTPACHTVVRRIDLLCEGEASVSSPGVVPQAVAPAQRSATSAAARGDVDGGRQTEGRIPSVVLLLTIEEAAVALAVPRSWLRDKVTARQVPHTRLGRHVRFTEEHLRQIIELGEEAATIGPVPTGGRHRRGRARATRSNGSAISSLPRLGGQSR